MVKRPLCHTGVWMFTMELAALRQEADAVTVRNKPGLFGGRKGHVKNLDWPELNYLLSAEPMI